MNPEGELSLGFPPASPSLSPTPFHGLSSIKQTWVLPAQLWVLSPLINEIHPCHVCCPCWWLARSPCLPQGLSASASISFPIIRVPASTEGVNSAKAPPHSGSSLPPSLPLLPLSSSLPFPPQLHRSLGRCRLQAPPSPAKAPSLWPVGKTPPQPRGSPKSSFPPPPQLMPQPPSPGAASPRCPRPS